VVLELIFAAVFLPAFVEALQPIAAVGVLVDHLQTFVVAPLVVALRQVFVVGPPVEYPLVFAVESSVVGVSRQAFVVAP